MTSVYPPVVGYPLPMSAIPIEPAPELLALARQAPVLRTSLPGNTTGWLVTGFEQVRVVLADPRFSRALAASPGREKRGIELISATSLGRLPGLRFAVGAGQLRFKENMTITSVTELLVTWDS